MLTDIEIKGFRCFDRFKVADLARVNLLVGRNNAGKTSVLEAIELLALGRITALPRSLSRREEEIAVVTERTVVRYDYEVSHLFHGHEMGLGSRFDIVGDRGRRFVTVSILDAGSASGEPQQTALPGVEEGLQTWALRFESDEMAPVVVRLALTGGLPGDLARRLNWDRGIGSPSEAHQPPRVNFQGAAWRERSDLVTLWDAIALTAEEDRVADALRIIEPRIERVAFLGEGRKRDRRVFVKLSGLHERVPLGSLGDGLKHLLALSLSLSSAGGGFLLVDEIDTGLHYSVMSRMWNLVVEVARRLDVQVVSTTHSLDCVRALALVCDQHPDLANEVRLHRIEKERPESVAYDVREIATAARDHIEVR